MMIASHCKQLIHIGSMRLQPTFDLCQFPSLRVLLSQLSICMVTRWMQYDILSQPLIPTQNLDAIHYKLTTTHNQPIKIHKRFPFIASIAHSGQIRQSEASVWMPKRRSRKEAA